MIPDLPPWTRRPPPAHCPDCHRVPRPGERHSLLDGLTDDGEPLGFTCLGAEGEALLPPSTEWAAPPGPDPWATGAPEDPPPF